MTYVGRFRELPQLIPDRLGSDPVWIAAVERVLSVALNEGAALLFNRKPPGAFERVFTAATSQTSALELFE